MLGRMAARTVQTSGAFMVEGGHSGGATPVTEYSVAAVSGLLGSVIHGLRIEVRFGKNSDVALQMTAADALQFAEEIRAAVHRRDDVRR